MRHLLASSAVAGLLFLLAAEGANAQDNRSTWGWGAAGGGGMVLSLIAAAAGAAGGSSIVVWRLSKLASKGKRDDEARELALKQVNSNIKVLDEKLTKLATNSEEGIHRLSRTLESKMNLGSVMNTVGTSLETVEQHIIKVEEMIERASREKEDNQIDPCTSNPDQTIEIYNNQSRSIIIDTNAIIDGRIIEMLESGVWENLKGTVVITDLLTEELMRVKDETDRIRGYKNLKKLRNNNIKNFIKDEDIIASYDDKTVNEKLSQLISDTEEESLRKIDKNDKKFYLHTSDTNGILITVDVDLASLCLNTNVRVLNLDKLYETIKPEVLLKRGQRIDVELNESNQDPNDAIGYYHGIMVVVKNGGPFVGQTKHVVITGISKNGRTPFAKIFSPAEKPPTVKAEDPQKTPPAP